MTTRSRQRGPGTTRSRAGVAPRRSQSRASPLRRGPLAGDIKARVLRLQDIRSGDPGANPDDPGFALRFLGEGDSWFSTNAIPPSANVLEQLHFNQPAAVLTLAQPGDSIRRMATISKNKLLRDYLAKPQFASRWDAILLSGGGNDIIDNAGSIVVAGAGDDPNAYLNEGALASTLSDIADGYRRIAELRDRAGSPNRGAKIMTHTYDYLTPRPAPAMFMFVPLSGPWLIRALQLDGIDDAALQCAIADAIIDRLADTLTALQNEIPNFIVADTRGLLHRSESGTTGNSHDSLNEIHPNSAGYRKVADAMVAAI